jgi:hypothetical protein
MIKALTIGLGIALSFGVASAQPKKAPARKKPAAGAKKPEPKAEAPAATPDAPADAKSTANDLKRPATDASDAKASDAKAAAPSAPGRPGGPMKTDEKASPNEKLDKRGTGDYRDVSAANERAASLAFVQANEQLNDGFFVKAAEKYREALSHWDHPAIHYNLALALINLDQPIEVYEQLNKALQYGPDPLEKDKYDHAKEYLRLVEGQLADVEVSCNQPGAKISVDNKEVFVAPGKFTSKVRVGKHTFFGDKEGYNARVETPFVGPGEKLRIELKVYTDPELTRYKRRWPTRTWLPYTVLGAGAVVGIVGGVLELSAQSSYDTFNARVASCKTDTMGCPTNTPGIQDERDSGDTKRTLGYVGYSVAGAAIATGAVILYMNRRQPYRITPEQLEQEKGQVSVTPIVSPEVVGAMVQGHF